MVAPAVFREETILQFPGIQLRDDSSCQAPKRPSSWLGSVTQRRGRHTGQQFGVFLVLWTKDERAVAGRQQIEVTILAFVDLGVIQNPDSELVTASDGPRLTEARYPCYLSVADSVKRTKDNCLHNDCDHDSCLLLTMIYDNERICVCVFVMMMLTVNN